MLPGTEARKRCKEGTRCGASELYQLNVLTKHTVNSLISHTLSEKNDAVGDI